MGLILEASVRTPLRVLSIYDDAINQDQTDLDAYSEDRDLKRLVLNEDAGPVWFTLRPVGKLELAKILGAINSTDGTVISEEVFRACCLNIQGLADEDGRPIKFRKSREPGWGSLVHEDLVRYLGPIIVNEMADVVVRHSALSDDVEKNS